MVTGIFCSGLLISDLDFSPAETMNWNFTFTLMEYYDAGTCLQVYLVTFLDNNNSII